MSEAKLGNYRRAQVWFVGTRIKVVGYNLGQGGGVELDLTDNGWENSNRTLYNRDEERDTLKKSIDIAEELRRHGYEVNLFGTPSINPFDNVNFLGSIEKARELLRVYNNFKDPHSPEAASAEDTDRIKCEPEHNVPPLHFIEEDEMRGVDEAFAEKWK